MSETASVTQSMRTTWIAPVRLPRVLRAEAIKLTTLPSFVVSFALAYIVLGGFGILTAIARILQQDSTEPTVSADPGGALAGIQGAQLIVIFTAAVFATTEFAQHTIQPSYLAVPKRLPMLLSKAILLGAVSFTVGAAGAATALAGAALVLTDTGLSFEITSAYTAQLVAGTALYLLAISLIGLAIGALIRSTVGAILAGIAMLNILPLLLSAAPFAWMRELAAYLPPTAGLMILQETVPAEAIQPWPGLGVAAVWGVTLFIVAAVVARRTDA